MINFQKWSVVWLWSIYKSDFFGQLQSIISSSVKRKLKNWTACVKQCSLHLHSCMMFSDKMTALLPVWTNPKQWSLNSKYSCLDILLMLNYIWTEGLPDHCVQINKVPPYIKSHWKELSFSLPPLCPSHVSETWAPTVCPSLPSVPQ